MIQVEEWNHHKISVLVALTGELIPIEVFRTSSGWWARKTYRGDEVGLDGAPGEFPRVPQVEEALQERDTFHKYSTKLQRLLNTGLVHIEATAP